jgi:cysteine synthase B
MSTDIEVPSRTLTRTDSIEAGIGNTPLIRLMRIARDLPEGVEVFAKAEHLNPGGSVKDRPALAMIREAERTGRLRPGKTILDASSGNTGIAYGMIGAARGYDVTLCLPRNASRERKQILEAYGVEVIQTNPMEGTDGAQGLARELAEEFPDKYVYLDQYNNEANWRAHYNTTALEIWRQTKGRTTHFLAGLGTTGSFTGIARRLKEFNSAVMGIALQPDSPLHGIEGLKHLSTARVPGIYDLSLADAHVTVTTEEALLMTQRLAKEEGLFVGPSSGANVFAALRLARLANSRCVVVTILCDNGERYLSEQDKPQMRREISTSLNRLSAF